MYEEFFGFKGRPFSLLPDPDFLYPSKRHRMALNMLEYGLMTQAGIMVITGEVGSGKTTLIRRFLRTAATDTTVGLITNTYWPVEEMLKWVLFSFNIDTPATDSTSQYKVLMEFLLGQYAARRRSILIIDEAQNLEVNALEALRLVSNVNSEKDQLLQLILVGQPELVEKLKVNSMRQFVQRISVHYDLEPLDAKDTAKYIKHRLTVVDGDPDIFSDEACAAVYYLTGGTPRLINTLCDFALVYGFAENLRHIGYELVLDVARDKLRGGLSPLRPIPADLTDIQLRHVILDKHINQLSM
ncbi:MAG TPA: AAA family ATPase [Patescibacteria group bacterium]|nr:AAA family ATPase [Patescibacteria group bacterium]